MSRQFYNLPSLNALAAFEAVARHQSLTLAASELGVTVGAVSRQIKTLEKDMGIDLLIREHKKISCNTHGEELYDALRLSFSNISKTINNFNQQSDEHTFSLGSTTAFSSLWLMPRLSKFWKQHPDIHINHVLSEIFNEKTSESIDISIRYGVGDLPNLKANYLFTDKIYPVCSPELAEQFQDIKEPEQLISLPLLQLHHDDKSWTEWRQWFNHFGVDKQLNNVSSYNNYIIALQAAQDSQGILLGWHRLVKPLIDQNRLKRLMTVSFQSPGSYYLYLHPDKPLNKGAKLFVNWLNSQHTLD